MTDDKRCKLVELGAEVLADALLELSEHNDAVSAKLERMTTSPKDNIRRFKSKLSGLKRGKNFVQWRYSKSFAEDLSSMLEDIKAGIDDPVEGIKLVVKFYEADEGTIGRCDDSSGVVGDVFRFNARDLFVHYASRCEDKQWLASSVLELNRKDPYGLRDSLIKSAEKYLPEEQMRSLIGHFRVLADAETNNYEKRHWLYLMECLAKQLKDARLFEMISIELSGKGGTAAIIQIAQAYLESGDPETALNRLEKLPLSEQFMDYDRDSLLLELYRRLGKKDKETETAWRIFKRYHSVKTLETLLESIGRDKRDDVIDAETERILGEKSFSENSATFLVSSGRFAASETYLLKMADMIDGEFYTSLKPLAKTLEMEEYFLASSIIYRALLNSIMAKAKSKYYVYGVSYLRKIEKLAEKISEWKGILSHPEYMKWFAEKHAKKSSFWEQYEQ